MDPLSLTASIIAIIGVGGQAAKAIKRLASAKGAPDSLLALNNEVSDLRLIVTAIEDIIRTQRSLGGRLHPGSQAYETSVNASIVPSLDQANQKVHELDAMYQRLTQSTFRSSTSVIPDVNRSTWLVEQRKLKLLQEDLRSSRVKLAAVLGLLNS